MNIRKINLKSFYGGKRARSSDLLSNNIHPRDIKAIFDQGDVIKVKRGLYKWVSFEPAELVDVATIVPQGILCLTSALAFHDLTTYIPKEYEMAIPRHTKVKLPDHLTIRLYYFSPKYYNLGVERVQLDEHVVTVFDREKSIVDCFRYRDKIRKDILLEAIKEYAMKKDRNFPKLMRYAEKPM